MKVRNQTRKLTKKQQLSIKRHIIQPRAAAGKIIAEKLREAFKASSPPMKEACPPLDNQYFPCASPPSLQPINSHPIIPSPTMSAVAPNSPPPCELPTPTMPVVAPTTSPPCESPTKLAIDRLLSNIAKKGTDERKNTHLSSPSH